MTVEAKFVPAYNPTTNNAELKPAWQELAFGVPIISDLQAVNITSTTVQATYDYAF